MKKLFGLLLLTILLSCQNQEKASIDLLIVNATILDVENGTATPDQMIGIMGDTIRIVSSNTEQKSFQAKKTLDAKGGFVMPGLWDNHVHFRGGEALIDENKALLNQFLSYGVTTVRDAGGDLTPTLLRWKKEILQNQLDGPDIFLSGPKLDGVHPTWEGSIELQDPSEVADAIDSLRTLEVDFVKIYDSKLATDTYYEIIKQTEKRGYNVTGHMPMNAEIMKAFDLGLDGIEHLYYLLAEGNENADSLRNLNKGYGILNQLVDGYNPALAQPSFEKLATRDFYVTPTLHIGEVLLQLYDTDHASDSLLQFIGAGIQKTYERRARQAKGRSDAGQQARNQLRNTFSSMVLPLQNAGVIILAGSDCGAYNSYVYPGASLIEELKALVEVGLAPQQAIGSSIINGPRFFGLEEYYGSIEVKKVANMIILTNNPLENINAFDNIHTVIKGTKIY